MVAHLNICCHLRVARWLLGEKAAFAPWRPWKREDYQCEWPFRLVAELRCHSAEGDPGAPALAMPDGDGAIAAGTDSASMVTNQIAALVPIFDPSKDDLQVYSQKVMLLLDAWPTRNYTELTTRLILNCSGSAFMKLQQHQTELMENERKSIKHHQASDRDFRGSLGPD